MMRTPTRYRFGALALRCLMGTLLVAGMLGATVAASAAQGDQVPTPREVCLAVFPDGIIVGDPVVSSVLGDIDCALIFGAEPVTETPTEPTETATGTATETPTETPTATATMEPTSDHETKTPVGGKAAPTVTTMPSTGHAAAADGTTTATLLALVAVVFAALAGATLRLAGVRLPRR